MIKVCIIGHFGFGKNLLNGQTIKTKTVTSELEKQLGIEQVIKIDTHGGVKKLPIIIIKMIMAFIQCENIIIFPAHNGVRIFVPLCNKINLLYKRKIHYCVIGGCLPSMIEDNRSLTKELKKITTIFVETRTMKKQLLNKGFSNVSILKNFKNIEVFAEPKQCLNKSKEISFCTFSRVMREKGIEQAVNAINQIEEEYPEWDIKLDIYGQIDTEQTQWFEKINASFPKNIRYMGAVLYDESVQTIEKYTFLLFPTLFFTEGIPGTIIDAFASGTPVIYSKWESADDILEDGKTGISYEFGDYNGLLEAIRKGINNLMNYGELSLNCKNEAQKYMPEVAIRPLLKQL